MPMLHVLRYFEAAAPLLYRDAPPRLELADLASDGLHPSATTHDARIPACALRAFGAQSTQ